MSKVYKAVNDPQVQYAFYKFLLHVSETEEPFDSYKVPMTQMKLQICSHAISSAQLYLLENFIKRHQAIKNLTSRG
jgi:hypothetical protein